MKLRPFITHTSILAAGILLTSSYFLFVAMPNTAQYVRTDVEYIDLPNTKGDTQYYKILEEYFLGDLYLRDPLYIFQRNKGHKIMESLAHRGYTPAADSLFYYHLRKAFGVTHLLAPSKLKLKNKTEYEEARKWAVVAAQQGALISLFSLLKFYGLAEMKDISKEIQVFEENAPKRTTPLYAEWLQEYYTKKGQADKAKYWAVVAKVVAEKPGISKLTIAPWKGF